MIKIYSICNRVYITRNGYTTEVTSGDILTDKEFETMICSGDVVCFNQETGKQITFIGSESTTAQQTASVPDNVVVPEIPAPDAGRVPTPVDTGSKSTPA